MSALMNPRVPGLGLAPAHVSRDPNQHRHVIPIHETRVADTSTTRAAGNAADSGVAGIVDRLARRLGRPSQPTARA
jgi:hypothetical protein